MGTPFGVRSWLWAMAHINCLYGQTFAKRSGRLWVTQWPYPWKNGSNKFLQQRRGDCSASDCALPVALGNFHSSLVASSMKSHKALLETRIEPFTNPRLT